MPEFNWDEENWDTLIYAIQQQDCILMLGPDAAMDDSSQPPRPLTEILAQQLAEKLEPGIKEKIVCSDLAQAAQHYCMEKGRHSLEARVARFYQDCDNHVPELHRNLAALPFYFTIATTPAKMLARALKEKNKEPIIERYHFAGENPGMVEMGAIEKPLLFYLYGTVDEPGSLLLTENDLLDFLVALISGKRPLPDNIRSELHDEHKSFLFLGFGFRHWYLRLLLHVLQGRNKGSHSFAMEQFFPGNANELQRTIFFYKRCNYKINLFKGELTHFVEQLTERFPGKADSAPGAVKRTWSQNAPAVFICHASEDKDYAATLYKTMAQAGIKPWLDKENLRGGDQWNNRIENTIKAVDYFVVLQSSALAEKHIGYVNREINTALDRRKDFRRGSRFIIPVKIEECPLLEETADLQTIDLTGKDNAAKLISTIKRDFANRGR